MSGLDIEAFLNKHGICSHPIAIVNRIRNHLDESGQVTLQKHVLQETSSWDILYSLLRSTYGGQDGIYKKHVQARIGTSGASYRYGCKVFAFEEISNKIKVHFQDENGQANTSLVDILIGADGANSTVRSIILPSVKTQYVGYVAWRGTVLESEVSQAVIEICVEKVCFFFSEHLQMIVYTIPGENGSIEAGKRLINWVWYMNYTHDSIAYNELMTDCDGCQHHSTIPAGKVSEIVWKQQRVTARKRLPPQFTEIVESTERPFIQCITDLISPRNAFLDGKVLLIGDSVATFRPHTGASTNQAAFHVLKLEEYLQGFIDLEQWQKETMKYATRMFEIGVKLGQESQFGHYQHT